MSSDPLAAFRVVRLNNEELAVSVLPDIGAKIYDLIDRSTGQNFLWHNARITPQRYAVEANFDNYWCGGWDDAFPTCEACTHQGESYPNLGELRSVAWEVEEARKTEARLTAAGPINPVRAEKTLRLDGRSLQIEYRIHNEGYADIDFIWGTHPAFAIEPGCRLHIPSQKALVSQANPVRLGHPGQSYAWPHLETESGSVDMSVVPPPGPQNAGHYVLQLNAGWYALEFPQRESGVLVEFPLDVCPHLWLWLSYGGWRGYYLAAIEPWTSVPVTLSEAAAAGSNRVLRPAETFQASIRATLWHGKNGLADLHAQKGL